MSTSIYAHTFIGIRLDLSDGITMRRDRQCQHPDNGYTFCPECGKRMYVDTPVKMLYEGENLDEFAVVVGNMDASKLIAGHDGDDFLRACDNSPEYFVVGLTATGLVPGDFTHIANDLEARIREKLVAIGITVPGVFGLHTVVNWSC